MTLRKGVTHCLPQRRLHGGSESRDALGHHHCQHLRQGRSEMQTTRSLDTWRKLSQRGRTRAQRPPAPKLRVCVAVLATSLQGAS